MKTRLFRSLLIIVSILFLSSCEEFLTKNNPNVSTDANFWNTEEDFVSGIASSYSIMTKEALMNARGWELTNGRSDEIRTEWVNQLADYCRFVYDPSLMYYYMRYSFFYKGIFRANHVISMIDQKGDFLSEEKKNMLQAEARFLRGYYHWMLLQDFGYIAFVDKDYLDMASMLTNIKQMHQDEVYPKIIEDLKFASEYLPEEWPKQYIGRATKGTALAYLGLVNLDFCNFEEASTILGILIGSDPNTPSAVGNYFLMPTPEDLWNPNTCDNNQESVFEAQFGMDGGPNLWTYDNNEASLASFVPKSTVYPEQAWISMIIYFHQYDVRDKQNEWAWAQWFRDPYKVYQEHSSVKVSDVYDPRLTAGFFFQWHEAGQDGMAYGNQKFTCGGPGKTSGWLEAAGLRKFADYNLDLQPEQSPKNYPLMRYADVLLLKAEAENEAGRPQEALKYVDVVRARAELPKILEQTDASSWTQEKVRYEIECQRIKELYGEGKRWYDMMRYSHNPNYTYNIKDTLYAHDWTLYRDSNRGLFSQNFVPNRDEYYPIPERALSANKNLKVNTNQSEFISSKFRK